MANNKLLLILVLTISACNTIIYETIPSQSPKLVVNSLFTPDSVFTVYVARSRSFNDQLQADSIFWVNDAVCSLYIDGSFLQVLQNTGKGRYVAPDGYKPQIGRNYEIKIWHQQLGQAAAESYVPQPPRLLDLIKQDTAVFAPDLLEFDIPDGTPSKLGLMNLRFASGGSDFYQIIARQTYAGYQPYNCLYCHSDSLIVAQRLVFLYLASVQDNIETYGTSVLVYSSDSVTHLTMLTQPYYLPYTDYLFKNLTIEVRSLSLEMYRYYKSLTRQSESTIMGTYEPVTYYTNVQGGYGIFAGYSTAVDSTSYPVSLDTAVLNHPEEFNL